MAEKRLEALNQYAATNIRQVLAKWWKELSEEARKQYCEQAIVEGADPNRTPTVSEFACLDIKHKHSILGGFKTIK